MLARMLALISEKGHDVPDGLYEWASIHDFLGLEDEAVPLYRSAIEEGLEGARRSQALLQLASSLRNVGEPEQAVELLQTLSEDDTVGDASKAFLSLALYDCGRYSEALWIALRALAPTLVLYSGAVEGYADALIEAEDATPD
jgi:tetratricopeptide (TPR) repeat protein